MLFICQNSASTTAKIIAKVWLHLIVAQSRWNGKEGRVGNMHWKVTLFVIVILMEMYLLGLCDCRRYHHFYQHCHRHSRGSHQRQHKFSLNSLQILAETFLHIIIILKIVMKRPRLASLICVPFISEFIFTFDVTRRKATSRWMLSWNWLSFYQTYNKLMVLRRYLSLL